MNTALSSSSKVVNHHANLHQTLVLGEQEASRGPIIINTNAQGSHRPIDPPWLTFVKGVVGTNVTIKVLCGMMRDGSLAEPYARYAAVARFMLDTLSIKCLDASFDAYVRDMTNTSWDGPAAGGGRCCLSRGLGVFPVFL